MVKHIILWQIKDEYAANAEDIHANAKRELEALAGKIPGMRDITLRIAPLATSNCDLMLEVTLDSEEALHAYGSDPQHVAVAQTYLIPYMKLRVCFDYEA